MAIGVKYNLYIGDINYNKLCEVDYTFLQYSIGLNTVNQAYFVVQSQSPQMASIGFNYIERIYTCIIEREGQTVFQGEIDGMTTPGNSTPIGINNEQAYGTLDRIGFQASNIIQRLKDLIIKGKNSDGTANELYQRSFANGTTLGTVVSTLLGEAIALPSSPVSKVTIGTIENPTTKDPSTGITSNITLTTDQIIYSNDYLFVIQLMAEIGYCDWYMVNGTQFNFVKSKQVDRSADVKFVLRKGYSGNNLMGITFNIDRQQMSNSVLVIGSQDGINQIAVQTQDNQGINAFGLREAIIPARLLDTVATATQYASTALKNFNAPVPTDSIQIYPDQMSEPWSGFGLGDLVSVEVDFDLVKFTKVVRVGGALITIEQNGVERIYYSLQEPK